MRVIRRNNWLIFYSAHLQVQSFGTLHIIMRASACKEDLDGVQSLEIWNISWEMTRFLTDTWDLRSAKNTENWKMGWDVKMRNHRPFVKVILTPSGSARLLWHQLVHSTHGNLKLDDDTINSMSYYQLSINVLDYLTSSIKWWDRVSFLLSKSLCHKH